MGVKIYIHTSQVELTDGLEVVEVDGKTVSECLDHLIERFPGMEKGLFKKKGKLHPYIEIYINLETAYPDELNKPVKDGDKIHIILMLAGG